MTSEELQGTKLGGSFLQNAVPELDALIAETLNESKIEKISSPLEEKGFAATPITIEKEETKPIIHPEIVHAQPVQPAPAPQAAAPQEQAPEAPKEEPKDKFVAFANYKPGDVIKGSVVKVDSSGALVDISYISDGFITSDDISGTVLKVGDKINVYINALSTKEGYVSLSIKKAEHENNWSKLFDSFKNKNSLELKVTSAVAGGLVVDFHGIRGFIPASQVAKRPEMQLADFVGTNLFAKVIEIDRRQSKLILSHKMGYSEKQNVDKDKLFEQIEIGQVLHGTVSNIKRFGAFVSINGVEGLIHINDLSWKRVDDPSKVVKVGQQLDVFVIGVDLVAKKISLGLKQLQPDPWASANEKYRAGQTVEVKVLRLAKFGAFVEIEEGLEGLIHNSELANRPVQDASEVVKPGDIVKAKILRVISDEQKIGLSMKEIEREMEKKDLTDSISAQPVHKITIGDTMSETLKEQLTAQNELPQSA